MTKTEQISIEFKLAATGARRYAEMGRKAIAEGDIVGAQQMLRLAEHQSHVADLLGAQLGEVR